MKWTTIRTTTKAALNIGKVALLGLLVGFYGSSAFAQNPTNAVERVEAAQTPGGQTLVKVTMREALAKSPSSFATSTPPRVALDFTDTENVTGTSVQQVGLTDLQSLNIVQSGNRTRLVLNLTHPVRVEPKMDGKVLYLTLAQTEGSATPAPLSTAVAPTIKESPSAVASKGNQLRKIDFPPPESSDVAVLRIDLAEPNPVVDVKRQGNSLVVALANTAIPSALSKRMDVRAFSTPMVTVTSAPVGSATQVTIANRGDWDYNVTQIDTSVRVEVRRVTADSRSLATARELQGKTVSFNFTQPVPLAQMVGILQDISGLNFIIMPGISKEIASMKMENVSVASAIEVIARIYGVAFRRIGDIVIVGTPESINKYDKDQAELTESFSSTEPIEQEIFKIRYRPAAEVAMAILENARAITCSGAPAGGSTNNAQAQQAAAPQQQAGAASASKSRVWGGMISARGSIACDYKSNIVFLEETKTQVEKIRERIQNIDTPSRQVMIEARMVEAQDTFFNSLGVKLSGNATKTQSSGTFSSSLPATSSGASPGTLAFSLFDPAKTRLVTLELSAVESDKKVKSIAAPKLITKDGEAAQINYGEKVPQVSYSPQTGPSVSMQDALISLDVKPMVQPDGKIEMEITVHLDSKGTKYDTPTTSMFAINKRDIKTKVVVENGGTLVIGGMYKQSESGTIDRIPFFGDLPYVGFLFKHNEKQIERSELLVFITPRVVTEDLTLQ